MRETDVLSLEGKATGKITLPGIFDEAIRPELVMRAVIAENTRTLQPQGHYLLAGMQTTARYYGKMSSYRTGRHMGRAIRPREKLGGGVQGKVRRIPSSRTGKRAHPHMIEKQLIEAMNKKEYQKALASAISATMAASPSGHKPLVVSNDIESVRKTKEMLKIFNNLGLRTELEKSKPRIRKGPRRSAKVKRYRKSVLLVISKEDRALAAARNIKGVDACTTSTITANLLAPGGVPGRKAIWSEQAIKAITESIKSRNI